MKVDGVSPQAVAEIASKVGVAAVWKPTHMVLRPISDRYSMVVEFDDDSELTVVCQHGQEAFLEELFRHYPDAHVSTPIADYHGLDGFEEIQPAVREAYRKRYGDDPCGCGDA